MKVSNTVPHNIHQMLMRLPIVFDWVKFKNEHCVASINHDATKKAGKPMMDISYCMTTAMNGIFLKTVQWDKSKFSPSYLGEDFKHHKE